MCFFSIKDLLDYFIYPAVLRIRTDIPFFPRRRKKFWVFESKMADLSLGGSDWDLDRLLGLGLSLSLFLRWNEKKKIINK